MQNILSLLAATSDSGAADNIGAAAKEAFKTFRSIINTIFPIFIGIILVVGLFYGVQLGIKYAKAEEDDEKKKAKGQLINVIVGCLIAVVFVAIIEIILNQNFIGKLFENVAGDPNTDVTDPNTPVSAAFIGLLRNMF